MTSLLTGPLNPNTNKTKQNFLKVVLSVNSYKFHIMQYQYNN